MDERLKALNDCDEAQVRLMGVHAYLERLQPPTPTPDFPVYGQQWQPWCNDRLGFGAYTIGGYGCLIASDAMIASHVSGTEITPRDVNERMKSVGGFVPGTSLAYFAKFAEAYPFVKYGGYKGCIDVPAPVDRIDEWLADGGYVIVRVDFNPRLANVQSHYLPLFAGNSATAYLGADPWIGSPVFLPPTYSERAGWDAARAIYNVTFYSKA